MEDYITLQDRMTDLLSRFCVWMWGEKIIRIGGEQNVLWLYQKMQQASCSPVPDP